MFGFLSLIIILLSAEVFCYIIKYDQYLAFFIWVAFINIFINIIYKYSIKALGSLQCFKPKL